MITSHWQAELMRPSTDGETIQSCPLYRWDSAVAKCYQCNPSYTVFP